MTEPVRERLTIPAEYGSPSRVLDWEQVSARLEAAMRYWLATTRPDGRPHTVPTDGLWLEDAFWFGGVPTTVKHRNLTADGRAAVHLPDTNAAVIVEGVCEVVVPPPAMVARLVLRPSPGLGPRHAAGGCGVHGADLLDRPPRSAA